MKKAIMFLSFIFLLIFLLTACPLTPTTVKHQLTMLKPFGEGTVDPDVGEYSVVEGKEVTLIATPDNGWQFAKWEVNEEYYLDEKEATLTMDSDKEVKAFFEEIPPEEYTLTMLNPVGNGSVNPDVGDHDYTEGTEVTLTATPDNGWEFVRWEVDGTEYSTDLTTTLTIDSDKEVKAFFEEIPPEEYTLTMLEPEGEGTTSPTSPCTYTYDEGTEVTLVATPSDGWEFDKWEIGGVVETESSTTIVMNKNITAKAFFEEIPLEEYTLTMLEPNGKGETFPTSPGTYTYEENTQITLTATPDDGWEFVRWEVDNSHYSTDYSTILTMNSDKKVKAIFTEIVPNE